MCNNGTISIGQQGFVPGPILFGLLVDSACKIWQEQCGETGQCLFYNNNELRLRTHGIPFLFVVGLQYQRSNDCQPFQ